MSDLSSFEDRFARLLRSYAEGGSLELDGKTIARFAASGVASRRRAPAGPWWWAVTHVRSRMLPQAAVISAVALIAMVGLATLLGGLAIISPAGTPAPSASVSASAMPTDSEAPAPQPSPSALEKVAGWPGTSGSGPGLYSWDGGRCADTCTASARGGFIHNCYGPCDVAITIDLQTQERVVDRTWSDVTIVGHRGWYRRVVEPEPSPVFTSNGPLHEEWIVEIDGVWIMIKLYAERWASDVGLADAHAIIDSLRAEPSNRNPYGFRLVFRLTNRAWDSG